MFIAVEGHIGSGRTELAEALVHANFPLSYIKDPASGDLPFDNALCSSSRILMVNALRTRNLSRSILPLDRQGFIVMTDRWTRSTYAEEGIIGDGDCGLITMLNDRMPKPHLVVVLTCDDAVAEQRSPSQRWNIPKWKSRFDQTRELYEQPYSGSMSVTISTNDMSEAVGTLSGYINNLVNASNEANGYA